MRNVDRLARHIAKNGAENIMVHTISGTSNWIIAEKIDIDKWMLTLANPLGNITYNLGTVTDNQHLQLWAQLTKMEVEKKSSQILLAKELKQVINNFLKAYEKTYKKFTKVEKSAAKGKQSRIKVRKGSQRSKKPIS